MSVLGTDSGSSKKNPIGSARLSDQGVPSLRKRRNSQVSPLVKLAFVSDDPYPGSRVTDSMSRSWSQLNACQMF
jgi:hypothetical protein